MKKKMSKKQLDNILKERLNKMSQIVKESKTKQIEPEIHTNPEKEVKPIKASPEKKNLARAIDSYFITGKYTVSEIHEKLKTNELAIGKNLRANIHARIVGHKRAGHRIEKAESGIITLQA